MRTLLIVGACLLFGLAVLLLLGGVTLDAIALILMAIFVLLVVGLERLMFLVSR